MPAQETEVIITQEPKLIISIMYGVRFNGSKVSVYKYEAHEAANGVVTLVNITPGFSKLDIHQDDHVLKSHINELREQYNAYMVYIESLDNIQAAINMITDKVLADKEEYLETVKVRSNEFDSQINIISGTDVSKLIKGVAV